MCASELGIDCPGLKDGAGNVELPDGRAGNVESTMDLTINGKPASRQAING